MRLTYAPVYELSGGRIAELQLDLPNREILAQLAAGPAGEVTAPDWSGNPS